MNIPSADTISKTGAAIIKNKTAFKAGSYLWFAIGASICTGSLILYYMPEFN